MSLSLLLTSAALATELLLPGQILDIQQVDYVEQLRCQPQESFEDDTVGDSREVWYRSPVGRHLALVDCDANEPVSFWVYPQDDPDHRYRVSMVEVGVHLEQRTTEGWRPLCDLRGCETEVPRDFAEAWTAAQPPSAQLVQGMLLLRDCHAIPEEFLPVQHPPPPLPKGSPPLIARGEEGIVLYHPGRPEPVVTLPFPWYRGQSSWGDFDSEPLVSPDGAYVVATRMVGEGWVKEETLEIFEAAGGPPRTLLEVQDRAVSHSFSPSSRYLLAADSRGVVVFALETLEMHRVPGARGRQVQGWVGERLLLLDAKALVALHPLTGEKERLLALEEEPRAVWWRGDAPIYRVDRTLYRLEDGEAQDWFTLPDSVMPIEALPSPDGRRLAWQGGKDLVVLEPEHSEPRVLTRCGHHCEFYWYDDAHLVFVDSSGPQLLVDLEGTVSPLNLTGDLVKRGAKH